MITRIITAITATKTAADTPRMMTILRFRKTLAISSPIPYGRPVAICYYHPCPVRLHFLNQSLIPVQNSAFTFTMAP